MYYLLYWMKYKKLAFMTWRSRREGNTVFLLRSIIFIIIYFFILVYLFVIIIIINGTPLHSLLVELSTVHML